MRLFYVMKALFMVCLGILRINAENLSLPNRIFKGQSANLNEFPHQVSIQVKRGLFGFFHFCGGSIVEASWVLTAGHCADLGANDRIVAGINNLKEKPSTRQVIAYLKSVYPGNFVIEIGSTNRSNLSSS